jgi:ribosomal protein S18 acetylase RimI-like enzyme
MIYREATERDIEGIARLHTQSWQRHYRGIWPDSFLNGDLLGNRMAVWAGRLQSPPANQYVVVAEDGQGISGFACTYADHDPVWGALVDNLHVTWQQQGRGIGAQLLKLAATWVHHRKPDAGIYLWVLERNLAARGFYERLGATNQEMVSMEYPEGVFSDTCRYVWPQVGRLVN